MKTFRGILQPGRVTNGHYTRGSNRRACWSLEPNAHVLIFKAGRPLTPFF